MRTVIPYLLILVTLFSIIDSHTSLPRQRDRGYCEFCTMRTTTRRCFKKEDWCDNITDCSNGSDERFCTAVFPNCGSSLDSCTSGQCIPASWFCDGQKDCNDGSDEDCAPGGGRLRSLSFAREKFRKWVLSQRSTSWGWEKESPRAIVAMYLMNATEFSSGNLVNELAAKELEAQLTFDLFRNHTKPLGEGQLALYLHAMLSTCIDPKHFHGLDMISALERKISNLTFVRPIAILALCNAGHTISRKYIDYLKNITSQPSDPIWIDTKAIALMALTCVMKQKDNQALNITIFEALLELKACQHIDGGFGDARTTAVITQALVGYNDYHGWNFSKAAQYLIQQHRNDSNGMLTNYLIMPLLSRRSLLNLREVNCSYKTRRNLRNVTLLETLRQKPGEKIHVRYSVQIGDNGDTSFTSTFRIPVNTTLYNVMRLANEMDKRYTFHWRKHHGRKYIYSINSIDNDPELRNYWTLYKTYPGEKPNLIRKDVDHVYPADSEHFVYWYKTVLE